MWYIFLMEYENLPLYDHFISYPNVFVRLHGSVIDSLSITSMVRTESLPSMRDSALIKALNRGKENESDRDKLVDVRKKYQVDEIEEEHQQQNVV